MKPTIRQITAAYFSPAGSTKKAAESIAEMLSALLCAEAPVRFVDFTLPQARTQELQFGADELVIFGTPTYAGRVPNKIMPEIRRLFHGNGTPAAAVVTFGNRSFDSSLTELVTILEENGFRPFAGGAFPCRHVFSDRIAAGRPDAADEAVLRDFAARIAAALNAGFGNESMDCGNDSTIFGNERTDSGNDSAGPENETAGPANAQDGVPLLSEKLCAAGYPVKPYYTPLGTDGQPAKFLKAVPVTDLSRCTHCGVCAAVCPMGSVDPDSPEKTAGICIKCHACIRRCPSGARHFDDPAFLSHKAMLEDNYTVRKEASTFFL